METRIACGSALLAVALSMPVSGQVTQRVSLDYSGAQSPIGSGKSSISADGRYVAFVSNYLVPGDTTWWRDVYVRDRILGTTERISIGSSGTEGDGDSFLPAISADGRYVAFFSDAPDLVPGDTNNWGDTFVRDRLLGTTERVSVDSSGAQANYGGGEASISADGRFVAFSSEASNLVPNDNNGTDDIFVRDRLLGTTECVSLDSSGATGNSDSYSPCISPDGRFVAFTSGASNLVPGDTNSYEDVFVRDRLLGTTERVSLDSGGAQGDYGSDSCKITPDGRYVVFRSSATNLVPGDTNGRGDIFVRDRQLGTTELVSVDSTGAQADDHNFEPCISGDGRFVAFHSWATNLLPADTNGWYGDVLIRDRLLGTTELVSVDLSGAQGNEESSDPSISADGRYVVFNTGSDNLVSGDTNGAPDVFVRDYHPSGFTSLCDPGSGGVSACPCSNPPAGAGRGCDNSSATGGASLSASGVAYLSMDSLVFTTSGEKPTATSILLQGTSLVPTGFVFGQGVRCAGGVLKRMYVKTASSGSITAPDLGAGDPSVSARSAALGDAIQPGDSRWYLVYYRDPILLGGCPVASGFNATQTGLVGWSP